jgi:prephenate dehydrogenase
MASPAASESQPIFDRIGIVGIRLIGGSVALAVRQRWPAGLVIGVDDKSVLEVAQRMHAVDVSADETNPNDSDPVKYRLTLGSRW